MMAGLVAVAALALAAAALVEGNPQAAAYTTPPPFHVFPAPADEDDMKCLSDVKEGCSSILDMRTCLNSRDDSDVFIDKHGLIVNGQACVWCGGKACRTGAPNLCEPYDFLVNGKGKAFDDYGLGLEAIPKVASCSRRPVVMERDTSCLEVNAMGCLRIETKDVCLKSKDGLSLTWLNGMRVAGEPCIWCGGMPCTDSGPAVCAPMDWALNGEGKAFQTFNAKGHFRIAGCQNGGRIHVRHFGQPPPLPMLPFVEPVLPTWWRGPTPTNESTQCLRLLEHGCMAIRNKEVCLSSRDGRRMVSHKSGLDLYGQPCVWCGGGLCEDNDDSMCAPWNFLVYGEGNNPETSEFRNFHAKDVYTVAACKKGKLIPPGKAGWGGTRPLWVPPKPPTVWDQRCLKPIAGGCSAAQDIGTCLDSKDGGAQVKQKHGLKLAGEPCVWCGGVPCVANATALCEPFDYVMRGEGKAFQYFQAKVGFTVATCQEPAMRVPEFAQTEELDCLARATGGCGALTDEASCLSSRDASGLQTFAGLKVNAQACVWCNGQACTNRNTHLCEPFDLAVNGLHRAFNASFVPASWHVAMCASGGRRISLPVPPPPLMLGATTTTLAVRVNGWGVHSVWPGGVVEEYAQCGGQGWNGPTACPPGFSCQPKSAALSRCLPSAQPVTLLPQAPVDAYEPGAILTRSPPTPGRFVTTGRDVWWQAPGGRAKHRVQPTENCQRCGCWGRTVLIAQAKLDAMEIGEDFHCAMKEAAEGPLLGSAAYAGLRAPAVAAQPRTGAWRLGVLGGAIAVLVAGLVAMYSAGVGVFRGERGLMHERVTRGAHVEEEAVGGYSRVTPVAPPMPQPALARPMAMVTTRVAPPVFVAPQTPRPAAAYPFAPPGPWHFRTVTFTGQGAESKASAFIGATKGPVSGLFAGCGQAEEPVSESTGLFDVIDVNHDGKVSRQEWEKFAPGA